MHVPTDRWTDGGWDSKLLQFQRLAEMLGLDKNPITPEDLQGLFQRVASAKVFADSVQPFIEASTGSRGSAADRIERIEQKLGLTEPIPFMSLQGLSDPREFDGVAIWPAGTTNWTKLRLEQIQTAIEAGAKIRRIICLGSSRVCNSVADRKHPLIAAIPEGQEPTERGLQDRLIQSSTIDQSLFKLALPPDLDEDRPAPLQQQLNYMRETEQYYEWIEHQDIYVPSTPNSLYVPLHVRRILGHDNVWFSQAGARLVRGSTDSWWPTFQDVMTLPNGIIRLWVELLHAGCITL